MPGIAGLVTRLPQHRALSQLRSMLGVMRHEPFYSTRMWSDEQLGVYVGWTARAGAFDDAPAQTNESGDVVLIFSGADYAPDDLRRDLQQRGHALDRDECSYLVHEYEEDPRFPVRLNGFFHGVAIDRRRHTASIFNDRYGMHRLYVHESKEAVYFAAEAKAILAVQPHLRRIDQRSFGESITLGCVLENRTLFDGIRLLPGASLWTFDRGRLASRHNYFQPREWEDQPIVDDEDFYSKLRDAFSRNLPRYFAKTERVGVSLTGGLDSRMVMAWDRSPAGTLPCYTWGSTRRDCRDVVVAREVARTCGQPYQVVPMGSEMLSRFGEYVDRAVFVTDGCVDAGLAPDVYMNERAREIAPARMTGLYGGEVLRTVRAFKHVYPAPGLFHRDLQPHFDQALATFRSALDCHPVSFAAFRQAPWHHYNSLSVEQSQVTMRSPFLDNDLVKTMFQASAAARTSNEASMRLIADGNAALAGIETDHGLAGKPGVANLARYGWHRFTFRAEYAFDRGMPQWLARIDRRLGPFSPEPFFLGRHKPLHFRSWYRDELAGYLREVLLDPVSLARAYLERGSVERIVEGHIRGDQNYTAEIHKLLKFELLHRHFVDGSRSAAPIGELAFAAAR